MANQQRQSVSISVIALTLVFIAVTMIIVIPAGQAQTFAVIHTFTGPDGAYPYGRLAVDSAGNLYGTTYGGGTGCQGYGCGTVFRLVHKNAGWIFYPLYSFQGGNDGSYPSGGVTIGPDGSLYGTTTVGGGGPCNQIGGPGPGCGTVFRLRPPARACPNFLCPWSETVLYRFTGGDAGAYPGYGKVVFDQAGDLYGTTQGDEGNGNAAIVFKLTHSGSSWTESLIYNFGTAFVASSVIFDGAGNLYGTTAFGGNGYGSVYELTPSGSGWTETTIYAFQDKGDGYDPLGGVAFDLAGNLYGTTFNDGGRVYQLTPSNGNWAFSTLHYFGAYDGFYDGPTLDPAGNVYGAVYFPSTISKLTRSNGWLETNLYNFTGGSDGVLPVGGVALDANGNIYGTTSLGGIDGCSGFNGCGTVFEITP